MLPVQQRDSAEFEVPEETYVFNLRSEVLTLLLNGMPQDAKGTCDAEKGAKVEIKDRKGAGKMVLKMDQDVKDDKIINPFEYMLNVMKMKNVKQSIGWSTLDAAQGG